MKTLLTLALLISLLFLFGCPGGEPPPVVKPPTPVPVVPPAPEPVLPSVVPNESGGNSSLTGNDTNSSNSEGNSSSGWDEEETPVFLGIPRNVSEKINDGEFWFNDTGLEQLKVYVLSCGNADCILVNKGHFFMLVDAGEYEPVRLLLARLGSPKIAVVVATRDDPGAINGLQSVLENFEVGEIWTNGLAGSSPEYKSLMDTVKGRGIAVKLPKAGDEMNVSGLRVAALNPQKKPLLGNPDVDAIVMKISSRETCMLFLNPTVHERETAIMNSKESLACDVMTYFKHGEGRPTPSLIVEGGKKPKDVVISVGPNGWDLPSPTTMMRLVNISKVNVWRTDTDGSIAIFSKNTGGYIIGRYNMTADGILPN